MAKRIFSRDRLRQLLEADSDDSARNFLGGYDLLVQRIEEMVRVEARELLTPRIVRKLVEAVRAEYTLQQAAKNADAEFCRPPERVYEATRDMTRGTRACLIRPMLLPRNDPFPYAKWLDSGRNERFGTSVLLLWTHRLYDDFTPTFVDPKDVPEFEQVREAAIRESKKAANMLRVRESVKSLPSQFRHLYAQANWGRWIWRVSGHLEQGSSPPPDVAIIEDKAVHQVLNFFADADVIHEVKSQDPRKASGPRVWRWMLVAPARVALIIRKVPQS